MFVFLQSSFISDQSVPLSGKVSVCVCVLCLDENLLESLKISAIELQDQNVQRHWLSLTVLTMLVYVCVRACMRVFRVRVYWNETVIFNQLNSFFLYCKLFTGASISSRSSLCVAVSMNNLVSSSNPLKTPISKGYTQLSLIKICLCCTSASPDIITNV